MRLPSRTAVRLILLVALALTLGLAVASAPAQVGDAAADDVDVLFVYPPRAAEPIGLSLADAGGTITTTYEVRGRDGETRTVEITPQNGAAVSDFLKAAGQEEGYAYADVEGTELRFSRRGIRSGDGAVARIPLIYVDEDGVHLLSPLGADEDDDADYVDELVGEGQIALRLTVKASLDVKVSAKPSKADAGEAVAFRATVLNGGIGDEHEFDWRFGDGTKPRGGRAVVKHTFEEAGRYAVRVTAQTDVGRGDASVTVRVGEPEDGGPDRKGSGTNEDDSAPSVGPYEGPSVGSPYSDSSSFDSTTPDYTPSTPSTPLDTPSTTSSGPTIEGNLLADVADPPSAGTADAIAAARTGTPDDPGVGDAAGVPTSVWALGGALGLLTVGAGLESGRLRRTRPRLPALPRRPRLWRR